MKSHNDSGHGTCLAARRARDSGQKLFNICHLTLRIQHRIHTYMTRRAGIVVFLILSLAACGGQSLELNANVPTGSLPIVLEVSPTSATTGAEVHVVGLGYSIVPAENIIHLGEHSTFAENYELFEGHERLTFTVPDDIESGEYTLLITVFGEPSNADTLFTVIP